MTRSRAVPAVAQLLYLLILQRGAKTIVEFGTSHGYSTIHLAAAAGRTAGHVFPVDDPAFLVSILPMHKDQLIAVRVAG